MSGACIWKMKKDGDNLHFFFDVQGRPAIVDFNGVKYWYVHNLQGDIVVIVDGSGNLMVEYTYDAWGKPLTKTSTLPTTLGTLNPFRYRGYVFDEETGQYYLRSRYNNPVWGIFISPDAVLGKVGGLLSNNPFAYCLNNPMNRTDSAGKDSIPDQDLGYPNYLENFFEGDIVLGSTNPLPYTGEPFSYAYGYNGDGELYERWYGKNSLPEMDIHHSVYSNPKMHTNPHKHIW